MRVGGEPQCALAVAERYAPNHRYVFTRTIIFMLLRQLPAFASFEG